MDESQLRAWLKERGVEDEAIEAIVKDSNDIRDMYAGLVEIGGALDHESWLDEISTTGRGTGYNQVVWFLLGMMGAVQAFYEASNE